jgi:hypothetical protein
MQRNRLWIEIIALGSAIALGVALLIASLGAVAGAFSTPESAQAAEPRPAEPQSAEAQSQAAQPPVETARVYEGMVTCSRCGAKHSPRLDQSAANCVRRCVRTGAGFALIDGDTTYELEGDLTVLKTVAGERARVTGFAHGGKIRVSSVSAA